MSKISVIIPVYNVEKYLEECIDSVLKQSYRDFEIILVDDGSTDSSGDICDRYALKDERIRVIHKENAGLSSARNAGFDMASGEYVYFLDSDDYIVAEAFEKLINAALENNADIVFFEADSFADLPQLIKGNYSYKKNYGKINGKLLLRELTENKEFHSAIPLLFLKYNFIKESAIRFTEGIVYEDMIYAFEVFYLADIVYHIPERFYKRRCRANSITTSKPKANNFISAYAVFNEIKRFSSKNKILGEDFCNNYISRSAHNCINIYSKLSLAEKPHCKNKFSILKKQIKENNAFGDKALYARCYGKIPWFIYKCIEKVFG